IKRARLDALRQGRGESPTNYDPSSSPRAIQSVDPAPKPDVSSKGIIRRAIDWLGPSDAASVPLPLLSLAGAAFLLLAAAAGPFLNRWIRSRRTPPPPG